MQPYNAIQPSDQYLTEEEKQFFQEIEDDTQCKSEWYEDFVRDELREKILRFKTLYDKVIPKYNSLLSAYTCQEHKLDSALKNAAVLQAMNEKLKKENRQLRQSTLQTLNDIQAIQEQTSKIPALIHTIEETFGVDEGSDLNMTGVIDQLHQTIEHNSVVMSDLYEALHPLITIFHEYSKQGDKCRTCIAMELTPLCKMMGNFLENIQIEYPKPKPHRYKVNKPITQIQTLLQKMHDAQNISRSIEDNQKFLDQLKLDYDRQNKYALIQNSHDILTKARASLQECYDKWNPYTSKTKKMLLQHINDISQALYFLEKQREKLPSQLG